MVTSKNGAVRVKAKVTDTIKESVVFLPMHWGKQLENDLNRTNNLTNTLVDPVSKEPDFKFTTVSVAKYVKPFQKIVIIGAGARVLGNVTIGEGSRISANAVITKDLAPRTMLDQADFFVI